MVAQVKLLTNPPGTSRIREMPVSVDQYKILLVDDHPLFRSGVAQLVATQSDFEIVGEATCAGEAVSLASSLRPHVVLMDLHIRDSSGIDALKKIKKAGLDTQVVILTVSEAEQDFVGAIRAGAAGYLLKNSEPDEILRKLRRAARGEAVFSEPLISSLVRVMQHEPLPVQADKKCLTSREHQILRLIATGKTNKHIARELNISDGTVKVHVKNMLRKLNLQSRLEAAVWALKSC